MLDPPDLLLLVERAALHFFLGHRSARLARRCATACCRFGFGHCALQFPRRYAFGAGGVLVSMTYLFLSFKLTRRSMFATVCAFHLPPRAVAMPRSFKGGGDFP